MRNSSKWRMVLCLIILALVGMSCRFPLKFQAPQPTPIPAMNLLLTPGSVSGSPTPFQPYVPQNSPTQGYQPPTPSPIPVDPSTNDLNQVYSNDQVNILFLGSDWRPTGGYRTDVILLISIHPSRGTVSLISFPRDLYVSLPGIGQQRINVAQEYGGFELSKETFAQNFGIRVDHYVMTNFSGFMSLVDALGGVEINASDSLYDTCKLPQAVDGYCYIAPGMQYMDGQTALWYVRSRSSTSDIDRLRRAQEVLVGLFHRLMSLDAIVKAPELFGIISNCIETDMSFDQIASLLPIAPTVFSDEGRIRRFAISWTEVTSYVVPESGAQVLLPNYDAINALLYDAFSR
jgi:LCP family protein required for cell wall assembly